MFFSNIAGQENLIKRLKNSVLNQRISHAQLIFGKPGHGTLPLALAYARYIMCSNRSEKDACGICPACCKISTFAHPDLHFVFPVIKNQKFPNPTSKHFLPQWREQLNSTPYFTLNTWYQRIEAEKTQGMIYAGESMDILHQMELQAFESEYKVTIIWMPETMHPVCSNKLLKLIEEPPEKTIFLLVAEFPELIIETVLSRTQPIRVPPISLEKVLPFIIEQHGLGQDEAQKLARQTNCDLARITEKLEQNESQEIRFEQFVRLMRLAYSKDIISLKRWSEELSAQSKESQKNFLSYAQTMLRENFIMNLKQADLNYMSSEELQFSSRFAPFVHEKNIFPLMDAFEQAERHVGQNVYAKMIFFDLSIKLIMLLKSQ